MNKILKNEKIYRNFIKKFKFIFKNKIIKKCQNCFDSDFKLIKFCLIIIYFMVPNPIKVIKNKHDELSILFCNFYNNQTNINYYKKIKNNFDLSKYDKKKFENFAICLYSFFTQEIKNKKLFIYLIANGLNYFFLNTINCKITLDLKHISNNKINFAIFVTKQFAKLKEIVLKNFKNNANILIILLIGMSNKMN